jgi:ParB family chromosome partitioning protein
MTKHATAENRPNVVGLQERRLDRTIQRTYRKKNDLDEVVPNGNQPRLGPKEVGELQRQIEANEGQFEPLLIEPHPELAGIFRIIDGDRRWTNSRLLVERWREMAGVVRRHARRLLYMIISFIICLLGAMHADLQTSFVR